MRNRLPYGIAIAALALLSGTFVHAQDTASINGTVRDPAQFAWMRKQSPYENVVPGRAYPAVLMTTGVNDPSSDNVVVENGTISGFNREVFFGPYTTANNCKAQNLRVCKSPARTAWFTCKPAAVYCSTRKGNRCG